MLVYMAVISELLIILVILSFIMVLWGTISKEKWYAIKFAILGFCYGYLTISINKQYPFALCCINNISWINITKISFLVYFALLTILGMVTILCLVFDRCNRVYLKRLLHANVLGLAGFSLYIILVYLLYPAI